MPKPKASFGNPSLGSVLLSLPMFPGSGGASVNTYSSHRLPPPDNGNVCSFNRSASASLHQGVSSLHKQPRLQQINKWVNKWQPAASKKPQNISHQFKRATVFSFPLRTSPPRLLLRVGTFFGERKQSLVPCRYCSYGRYQRDMESSASGRFETSIKSTWWKAGMWTWQRLLQEASAFHEPCWDCVKTNRTENAPIQ